MSATARSVSMLCEKYLRAMKRGSDKEVHSILLHSTLSRERTETKWIRENVCYQCYQCHQCLFCFAFRLYHATSSSSEKRARARETCSGIKTQKSVMWVWHCDFYHIMSSDGSSASNVCIKRWIVFFAHAFKKKKCFSPFFPVDWAGKLRIWQPILLRAAGMREKATHYWLLYLSLSCADRVYPLRWWLTAGAVVGGSHCIWRFKWNSYVIEGQQSFLGTPTLCYTCPEFLLN